MDADCKTIGEAKCGSKALRAKHFEKWLNLRPNAMAEAVPVEVHCAIARDASGIFSIYPDTDLLPRCEM